MITLLSHHVQTGRNPKANARPAHGERRRQCGFTLIEVMVSLSLMVILFSVLYGGFRFGYQAWDKMSENTARASEYQATYRIVGTWLSRFYPVIQSPAQDQRYAFYGTQDRVYFTAFMPSYPTRGGLFEVLFSLENAEGVRKLLVYRRFFDPERDITTDFNSNLDPDQGEILLEDVKQNVRFDYFGRKAGDPDAFWHSEWSEPHRYPQLIRLRLSQGGRSQKAWPDVFIPITVNQTSVCLSPQPDERGFCDIVRQMD